MYYTNKISLFKQYKTVLLIFIGLLSISNKVYSQEIKNPLNHENCLNKFQNNNSDGSLSSKNIIESNIEFCKIDNNEDGVITLDEYKAFQESQKTVNSTETEGAKKISNDTTDSDADGLSQLKKYISIQQSYLNGDSLFGSGSELLSSGSADPATLTYTFNSGEDTFKLDAAVIFKAYDGNFNNKLIKKLVDAQKNGTTYESIKNDLGSITGLTIAPVIEAHISSSDRATDNSLQFQVPFVLRFTDARPIAQTLLKPGQDPEIPFLFAQHFIGSPKFTTDRDFRTKVIGFDLLYTPTIPSVGMGASIPFGKFEFRWRPLVGFEFEHILDNPDNLFSLPVDNFARATGRLRLQLAYNKSFVLSSDYIFRFNLTNGNKIHQYLDLSAIYYLDKNQIVSIGASYKVGENSPRFEYNEEVSLFLGFKF
jgi:hypothetical protein